MENITTDQDFEEQIKTKDKLILVDFFATWCGPCQVLGPILEKLSGHFKEKIVFVKADLDNIPQTAQKFGVEKIPTVIVFKNGEPLSGFVGLIPEKSIKEWLENILEKEKSPAPTDDKQNKVEKMKKEFSDYAKKNGFKLNPDEKTVERVIDGLLRNKEKYGEEYCPCRRVSGDKEEDTKKICPCFWHKDEIEKDGHCFCQLYFKS